MIRWMAENFGTLQLLLGAGLVLVLFFVLRRGEGKSRFKLREADRVSGTGGEEDLAEAKFQTPLSLPGHQFNGAPHEILGVRKDANPSEIEQAYKKLIRRFHPDRVGRPGSREWQDAQEIAAKINEARKRMLS